MKDPGPYPVELLKAILEAQAPALASSPGIFSLKPILLPAIFYDDCEGTPPYIVTGTGDGYQASYVTEAAFVGLHGLKIQTRETGAAGSDNAAATIHLPANELPIIRLQALFARPETTSTNYYTEFRLRADDETSYFIAQVRIGWQAPSIEYHKKINAGWSYTAITGWYLEPAHHAWNHLQLAINVATGCYLEIKLNGKTHSIPTEPLEPGATQTRGPLLDFQLKTTAIAALQSTTPFAQILVTAEEAPSTHDHTTACPACPSRNARADPELPLLHFCRAPNYHIVRAFRGPAGAPGAPTASLSARAGLTQW